MQINIKTINILVGQINPIVADIKGNINKIIDICNSNIAKKADLIIFPELAITGYIPEDILLRDEFILQIKKTHKEIANKIKNINILFGSILKIKNNLYNIAVLIKENKKIAYYIKSNIPNYGVFDEKRYFNIKDNTLVFEINSLKIGVIICEDLWTENNIKKNTQQFANIIICLNASPYEINKFKKRINIVKKRVLNNKISLLYINCVGGQDELVFDGGSFFMDKKGNIIKQLPFFKEKTELISYKNYDYKYNNKFIYPKNIENIWQALVVAIRDYINKNKIKNVIIGLSGGIDSALVLALAYDALGKESIYCIMLASCFTSDLSKQEAKKMADLLKIKYDYINIDNVVNSININIKHLFKKPLFEITKENIQARIRGNILMAIANNSDSILLCTSNKSELAVGYSTLYGDTCGGFAPIKDISKTLVYKLAKYRNTISKIIPINIIKRAPSAELAKEQLDQDTLPDYKILDKIIHMFVEKKKSIQEINKAGVDNKLAKKIVYKILNSEYKRKQCPIGPKITNQAFGKDRRYPITSRFEIK